MLNKEEIYEVEIVDMSFEGKGVAKVDGIAVFVDDAVTGDKVKVKITKAKKRYAFGEIVEVVELSNRRAEPLCEYYSKCGGCDIMHLSYDLQTELKLERVRSILRTGASVDTEKVKYIKPASEQFGYRNKYYVQAEKNGRGYKFGHFKRGSNKLVETKKCLLTDDKTNKIVKIFSDVINNLEYDCGVRNILVRTNNDCSEFIVCIVLKAPKVKDKTPFIEACESVAEIKGLVFNYNFEGKGDILGRRSEVIYGDSFIYDQIGDKKFKVEFNAFFQVNRQQTHVLYDEIVKLADLKQDDVVIDAFCGAGSIGIYIADKVKSVIGIEVVENAIDNANYNKELNNVENIEFVCGRVEQEIQNVISTDVSTVILDPPRKGCDQEILDSIVNNEIETVIYVSCKTENLAKDLKYLQQFGYDLVEAVTVDMFVNCVGVETIAKIKRVHDIEKA